MMSLLLKMGFSPKKYLEGYCHGSTAQKEQLEFFSVPLPYTHARRKKKET
jgi:hypothetical protein